MILEAIYTSLSVHYIELFVNFGKFVTKIEHFLIQFQ
jgi:hypothetical protein